MSASDIAIAFPGTSAPASLDDRAAADRRHRRLSRFQQPWQKIIAGLTACAPELEDLAETFPALLFALVSGYGTAAQRSQASAMIASGSCLKSVAEVLELPWWTRRLPPDAFTMPLPRFPTDAEYASRMVNCLPKGDAAVARQWLNDISIAHAAAGSEYALWFARHIKPNVLAEDAALMMGAWVWFSQSSGHLGSTLVRKSWAPDMSARRALDEFSYWRRRLRLVDALGLGLEDCWLTEATIAAHTFVALRTVTDFLEESQQLENCLDQFADHLVTGHTFVFSIRRGERRIACVEIGAHDTECTMPAIVQLRGPRNRRTPPSVWQATFAWLGSQRLTPRKARSSPGSLKRSVARQQLWQPFLEHVAGTPYETSLRRWLMLPTRGRRGKCAVQEGRRRQRTSPDAQKPNSREPRKI